MNVKPSNPSKIRLVPLDKTRPAPSGAGQRTRLIEAHVDFFMSHMDLNALGFPCLNLRDGVYWIFDGQHRIEALKRMNFEALECRVFENLSDADMASMFLNVNTGKAVDTFSKFSNACAAGYKPENDVRRAIESQGLRVSRETGDNCVGAIASCLRVYHAHGDVVLGKALRVLRDAYDGAPKSFEGNAIHALGLVFARYEARISESKMVSAIAPIKQGVVGLNRRSEQLRLRIGNAKVLCLAATLVDIYNKNERGNGKLPSWWQE